MYKYWLVLFFTQVTIVLCLSLLPVAFCYPQTEVDTACMQVYGRYFQSTHL
jgi:hypothetical protein